jgi:hypothetical protein
MPTTTTLAMTGIYSTALVIASVAKHPSPASVAKHPSPASVAKHPSPTSVAPVIASVAKQSQIPQNLFLAQAEITRFLCKLHLYCKTARITNATNKSDGIVNAAEHLSYRTFSPSALFGIVFSKFQKTFGISKKMFVPLWRRFETVENFS